MSALQGYRELTYRLAGDLQAVADIARRRDLPELGEEADAVRRRIESRRFTLAVVGEFKRGKSTFINALLGSEILPADVLPTSATVNRVTFGLVPRATLYFRDDRPPEDVPIASLADHVTKLTEASAARAATVREAVVAYPLALCRNDVDLIDTPGLSDEASMTDVTVGVLPAIDAAIVVLMADSPFSGSEAALVERLVRQGVGHLLFVVTAIDRIRREEDRLRVVEAVKARLRATGLLGDGPTVFPVSGRWALDARLEGDVPLLEKSGFLALEEGLQRDLLRTDGLALARRLHQLGEQCARLLRDGRERAGQEEVGPPPARARLLALLEAAERGLDRTERRWAEASEALVEALRPELEGWPRAAAIAAGGAVARHKAKAAPGWLDRREQVLSELADDLVRALDDKLREELGAASAPLDGLAAASAELERAAEALGIALSFAARQLGTPPPPPGAFDGLRGVSSAPPSEEELGELRPSRALLLEAIDQPELAKLGRGAEKLDFLSKTMAGYNLPAQFARIATAGLSQRLGPHWEAHPPLQWLERWWGRRSEPVVRGLSEARALVRSLRGAVEAWAERQAVLRERDQRELALEARRLVEIRGRAEQLREELKRAGF